MDLIDNTFIKYFFFVALIILLTLFYTRPERDMTPDMFVRKMDGFHYQVYKQKGDIQGADVIYMATNPTKMKVHYIHFLDEADRKRYYQELTKDTKHKHMLSIARDQRLHKVAAEKLSYFDDDIFYVFLFTKKSIVYSKTYTGNTAELTEMFGELYKPDPYTKEEMIQYYKDYFSNLPSKIQFQH